MDRNYLMNGLEFKMKFYLILYAVRCIEFFEQVYDSNIAACLEN